MFLIQQHIFKGTSVKLLEIQFYYSGETLGVFYLYKCIFASIHNQKRAFLSDITT